MNLQDRIERPRLECGVDYGAGRIVVAIAGDRELYWQKSHKAWGDRMSGYVYVPGSLVLKDRSSDGDLLGTTLVEGGRLSAKMLRDYAEAITRYLRLYDIDGRPGSCGRVPLVHEVYKAGFTIWYEDGDFAEPDPQMKLAERERERQRLRALDPIATGIVKDEDQKVLDDLSEGMSLIADGCEDAAEDVLKMALSQLFVAEGLYPGRMDKEWADLVCREAERRLAKDPLFAAWVRLATATCMMALTSDGGISIMGRNDDDVGGQDHDRSSK